MMATDGEEFASVLARLELIGEIHAPQDFAASCSCDDCMDYAAGQRMVYLSERSIRELGMRERFGEALQYFFRIDR